MRGVSGVPTKMKLPSTTMIDMEKTLPRTTIAAKRKQMPPPFVFVLFDGRLKPSRVSQRTMLKNAI